MKTTYTQCRLRRGNTEQVAWIPSQFAVTGKSLTIRGRDGWQVIGAGARLDASFVERHERDYRDAFPSLK